MSRAIPAPASRRATDFVYRHIERQIMLGTLTPGERIDTDAVAAELQVSRTPVREALLQLEREGLVDRQAYKGTIVAGVDPVRLEENSALRIQLEGLAAALGTLNTSATQIAQMEEAIAELDAHTAAPGYSVGLFNELNRQFHNILYEASGKESLVHLIDGLQTEADRIRLHFDVRNSGANQEHRAILAAVKAGDAAAAQQRTQRHILNAYLRTLGAERVPLDAQMMTRVVETAGLELNRTDIH